VPRATASLLCALPLTLGPAAPLLAALPPFAAPAAPLVAALPLAPPPDDAPLWERAGAQARDGFGSLLVVVGDVDGDGHPDVLAGCPAPFGGRMGAVRLLSGADGRVLLEASSRVPDDRFGASVDLAGDIDRDGTIDVLVGCPLDAASDVRSGSVSLVSGKTGSELRRLPGTRAFGEFGRGVAGVGDLDGDGAPEIVVSEPGPAPAARAGGAPGRVLCLSSAEEGGIVWQQRGASAEERFGACLARLPDLDGDGIDDLAVGAPGARPAAEVTGRVLVLSGADGRLLWNTFGFEPGRFGSRLAPAGDIDGDGSCDLLVGDPDALVDGLPAGRAWLLSGFDGALLRGFAAPQAGGRFGSALAGLGDIDGDEGPDLAIGAPADAAGGYAAGRVRVFSGRSGELLREVLGSASSAGFGAALAGLGDLDADGTDELLVGLLDLGGPQAEPGAVRALRGKSLPAPSAAPPPTPPAAPATPATDGGR